MSASLRKTWLTVGLAAALLAAACGPLDLARDILRRLPTVTPTAGFEIHESSIWYVSKEGDDADTCDAPERACLTIEEAIARADDDDVINVAAGVYLEDSGAAQALRIQNENLVLRGVGAGVTIIDGGGERGGLLVSGDSVATIRDLTVRNTVVGAPGNCISVRNEASARIQNVTVQNCGPNGIEHFSSGRVTLANVEVSASNGPGVYVGGEMVIEGGRFHDNDGYGILTAAPGGRLTLTGALIENNVNTGLVLNSSDRLTDAIIRNNGIINPNHSGIMVGGEVTLTNVQVLANGYGIKVLGSGQLAMTGGEISQNIQVGLQIDEGTTATLNGVEMRANGEVFRNTSVPGHIYNLGTLLLVRSVLADSFNGALLNRETGNFTMRETAVLNNGGSLSALTNYLGGTGLVERSLFAGNQAAGGAIRNDGTLTLLNTTVTGTTGMGIVAARGSLSLSYVTIADNRDYGLAAFTGGAVVSRVENTLIARNGDGDCSVSSASGVAPLPLAGVNIDTDGTCGFGLTVPPAELGLDGLADNGGETQTQALLPGSPAIEAATGACPATDQRSEPYTRPFGPACDVGAYEAGGTGLSLDATLEFETVTPTPEPPQEPLITVDVDTGCFSGPGPGWAYLLTVKAGTTLKLVGYGFQPGWYVAQHPTAEGVQCWLAEKDVTPNVPPETLRLIAIPPKPTATPPPTKIPESEGRETSTPQIQATNTPCGQQCP
jgi:hypothetical protein